MRIFNFFPISRISPWIPILDQLANIHNFSPRSINKRATRENSFVDKLKAIFHFMRKGGDDKNCFQHRVIYFVVRFTNWFFFSLTTSRVWVLCTHAGKNMKIQNNTKRLWQRNNKRGGEKRRLEIFLCFESESPLHNSRMNTRLNPPMWDAWHWVQRRKFCSLKNHYMCVLHGALV